MAISPKYYVTWGCHMSIVIKGDAFSPPICFVALLVAKKPIAPSSWGAVQSDQAAAANQAAAAATAADTLSQ
jgi:hypothetical protein